MDKLPDHQRSVMIVIVLWIFLGSIMVCEVIDPLFAAGQSLEISYEDGLVEQNHIEEHEDDFVVISLANGNVLPFIEPKNWQQQPSSVSCVPASLLPPPKDS